MREKKATEKFDALKSAYEFGLKTLMLANIGSIKKMDLPDATKDALIKDVTNNYEFEKKNNITTLCEIFKRIY